LNDGLRLSAFRFLFSGLVFWLGIDETGVAKRKSEAPPLDFPGFELYVAGFSALAHNELARE
jgi:hypothetical protein